MIHDLEKRKAADFKSAAEVKKEDTFNVCQDGENQDVKTLRERFDDLCHEFNHDNLDPVNRVLKLAEIKRVREAIKTVERLTKEAHAE